MFVPSSPFSDDDDDDCLSLTFIFPSFISFIYIFIIFFIYLLFIFFILERYTRTSSKIVSGGSVFPVLLMQTLLLDPLLNQHKEAQKKLDSLMSTNQRMQSEIVVLQRDLAKDPDEGKGDYKGGWEFGG